MAHIALDRELALRDTASEPLSVRATDMAVTEAEGKITECRLTFQVSPEVYRRIDEQALFNLKPEVRVTMPDTQFDPDRDIEIQARIEPERLALLSSHATTVAGAAEYLLEQNQNNPDSLFWTTENWFALYVTQEEPLPPGLEGELKIGYSTTWADV